MLTIHNQTTEVSNVKFFLDTADLNQIEEAASWGAIAGVTTNPTLYSRIGGKLKDFPVHIARICELVDGPVSAETNAKLRDSIIKEGRELADIHPNVVVKVPTTIEGLAATRTLANEGIRVNMTLCFTVPQAVLAARAGARYVSPFLGRFDDIGEDGVDQLAAIIQALSNYDFTSCGVKDESVEVIAASIRSVNHVAQAALLGADIATVPFDVLRKCVRHPLTDRGLEQFEADWEKVKNA
jgi:transaldolase